MRLLWPALTLTVTGCTLLVSTDHLDDGPGFVVDSGGGSDDTSLTKTPGTDAASKQDGDATTGYAPFCANLSPKPSYCFDFSEAQFDATQWDQQMLIDGTVTVENNTFLATTNPTGDTYRPAFVQKNIGGTKTSYRIEADVRVEKAEPLPDNSLGARFLGFKAGVNVLVGLRHDNIVIVAENWGSDGSTRVIHGSGTHPANAWFHVAMTYDLASNIVTVTLDGTTISDGTKLAGPVDTSKSLPAIVGLYYPPVSGDGFAIRYDNVVIDIK